MSKTDNKILFLDEDGSEIEFRVIEHSPGLWWKCTGSRTIRVDEVHGKMT